MNPSVIDVQISMPNVDIQWLLNSRMYVMPRFYGITSPLSNKTVAMDILHWQTVTRIPAFVT